jgi:hypothetical protein
MVGVVGVHSSKLEMATMGSIGKVWAVYASAVGKNVSKGALDSKFAVALPVLSVSCPSQSRDAESYL